MIKAQFTESMREAQQSCKFDQFIWSALNQSIWLSFKDFYDILAVTNLPCFRLLELGKRLKMLAKVVHAGNRDTSMANCIFKELQFIFEQGEIAELILIKKHFLQDLKP